MGQQQQQSSNQGNRIENEVFVSSLSLLRLNHQNKQNDNKERRRVWK